MFEAQYYRNLTNSSGLSLLLSLQLLWLVTYYRVKKELQSFYSAAALPAMQSAVLATAIPFVCLSVCPPHAGTLSRRINIGSRGLLCDVGKHSSGCGLGLGELPKMLGFRDNISATAEDSQFKIGMRLGFAKAHHKIPHRRKSNGGPGLEELPKIFKVPL